MADPNHPRKFTEEFRRQIVQLYLAGKPKGELVAEFDIRRSLSRKGNPCDNAVIESTNRILKKELIYQRAFADLGQLRRELNSYVRWRNEERTHSTLGYMSPVEFRNAGLSLQELFNQPLQIYPCALPRIALHS